MIDESGAERLLVQKLFHKTQPVKFYACMIVEPAEFNEREIEKVAKNNRTRGRRMKELYGHETQYFRAPEDEFGPILSILTDFIWHPAPFLIN